MATSPLLDFDALIAPIAGEDAAGSALPFDVRSRLEEDRKEVSPDPNDPHIEPKMPNWSSIIRLSQQALTENCKDLLVAARLTEALTKEHHFAGLRDGLRLMRELVEQCWDRLYPPLEDSDLEIRISPFVWLDDPSKGACFPSTVRLLPLVFSADDKPQYSWQDWQDSQTGKGITSEEFERAIVTTPQERYEAIAREIGQSLEELSQLTQSLQARMDAEAPGLIRLREAVEDCRWLVEYIGKKKCPQEGAGADTHVDGAPAGQGADGASLRRGASRAEVYRQLSQAGALLQQLEPHSPIPYLIQRAVELGAMPFPQLIKALIRDANVLAELNRELGLKETAPEE